MLEGYILHRLNNNLPLDGIDDVVGNRDEIEFCGNQIQYGISGNKVDILLLHKKSWEVVRLIDTSTVIELKRPDQKGRYNTNY